MRWQTTDPLGFKDGLNLYCYVHNNPFCYKDPDRRFAFVIPFIVGAFGAEGIVICGVTIEAILGTTLGATIGVGGYQGLKWADNTYNQVEEGPEQARSEDNIEKKKRSRTNPFDDPVDEDIIVIDDKGNAIKVPHGNWLTGTKDGEWIQERTANGTKNGQPTGLRKDGGHKPSPVHTDPRSLKPHAHVPEVTNIDGAPWLSIY